MAQNMMTEKQVAKRSLQNGWGTIFFFFCQWLLSILVVRLNSFEAAGIYSLALSYANIFGFIANFGVRAYQVSDVERTIKDGSFIAARFISCGAAALAFAFSFLFSSLSQTVLACAIILVFQKLLEAFSDVICGIFQQIDRYDAIAISLTAKGISSLGAFCVLLVLTSNILWACLAMALAYGLVILLYDCVIMFRSPQYKKGVVISEMLTIFRSCFSLMLFTLINPLIIYINRYYVERLFSAEELGYYSSISVIISALSSVTIALWGAFIPHTGRLYHNGDIKKVIKNIIYVVGFVFLVCGAAFVLSIFFGEWALTFVFGKEIAPYAYLLPPCLLVALLTMLVSYTSTLLTMFKCRIPMLLANCTGPIVCLISIAPFLQAYGLLGAFYSLTLSMGAQLACLIILISLMLRRKAVNTV